MKGIGNGPATVFDAEHLPPIEPGMPGREHFGPPGGPPDVGDDDEQVTFVAYVPPPRRRKVTLVICDVDDIGQVALELQSVDRIIEEDEAERALLHAHRSRHSDRTATPVDHPERGYVDAAGRFVPPAPFVPWESRTGRGGKHAAYASPYGPASGVKTPGYVPPSPTYGVEIVHKSQRPNGPTGALCGQLGAFEGVTNFNNRVTCDACIGAMRMATQASEPPPLDAHVHMARKGPAGFYTTDAVCGKSSDTTVTTGHEGSVTCPECKAWPQDPAATGLPSHTSYSVSHVVAHVASAVSPTGTDCRTWGAPHDTIVMSVADATCPKCKACAAERIRLHGAPTPRVPHDGSPMTNTGYAASTTGTTPDSDPRAAEQSEYNARVTQGRQRFEELVRVWQKNFNIVSVPETRDAEGNVLTPAVEAPQPDRPAKMMACFSGIGSGSTYTYIEDCGGLCTAVSSTLVEDHEPHVASKLGKDIALNMVQCASAVAIPLHRYMEANVYLAQSPEERDAAKPSLPLMKDMENEDKRPAKIRT